jgi:hypothetical protein
MGIIDQVKEGIEKQEKAKEVKLEKLYQNEQNPSFENINDVSLALILVKRKVLDKERILKDKQDMDSYGYFISS